MMTLRDAMDRLFDEAFTRPFSLFDGGTNAAHMSPAIDMYQTSDDVVIKAALPGLKADEVQINVTGDVLTLRGETRQSEEVQEQTYHLREHRWGSFERSIPLPVTVLADKAKAEFENGVLTVTLPKAEEVRPKTIAVKAK